ncbi:MAG: hypothetical protein WCO97_00930 [bacterium]
MPENNGKINTENLTTTASVETVGINVPIETTKNEIVTIETIKELKNELYLETDKIKEDFKKSRVDYIQIFGVFAAIMTLVGFNASAGQKSIIQILVGNLALGFILIGFIYLLYVVPERIKDTKPILFLKMPKRINVIIGVGIILIILTWILMDRNTNIGLCTLYPLHHLEIDSITYCNK